MKTLNSILYSGKYIGWKIRDVLEKDPDYIYDLYLHDSDFDLYRDVIIELEKKGYRMKKAILEKIKLLQKKI